MNKSKENHNKLDRAADRQFVMWAGALRALPFLGRIKVTKAADFDLLSVTTVDYAKAVAGGLSAKDILSLAADQGIKITHMDPLTRRTPVWEPGGGVIKAFSHSLTGSRMNSFASRRPSAFSRCTSSRCFGPVRFPWIGLANPTLRSVIAPHHSVFIAVWSSFLVMRIPDLATARNIVESAGRENSGIIADAKLKIPPGVSILQDCFPNRAAAGEGELPINRILQTLDQIGGLRSLIVFVRPAELVRQTRPH
jgi:hypothetical protein